MSITAKHAKERILQHPETYSDLGELRNLISQLSTVAPTDAPGKTTVTYSGGLFDGLWSTKVAEWLTANAPDARIIDRTQGAIFLMDEYVKQFVEYTVFASAPNPQAAAAEFLNGDPKASAWGIVSKNQGLSSNNQKSVMESPTNTNRMARRSWLSRR